MAELVRRRETAVARPQRRYVYELTEPPEAVMERLKRMKGVKTYQASDRVPPAGKATLVHDGHRFELATGSRRHSGLPGFAVTGEVEPMEDGSRLTLETRLFHPTRAQRTGFWGLAIFGGLAFAGLLANQPGLALVTAGGLALTFLAGFVLNHLRARRVMARLLGHIQRAVGPITALPPADGYRGER